MWIKQREVNNYHTIKIWNITLKELKLLLKLTNHTDYVYKVIPLNNNKFCSCSNDKTVKIWNSESYKVLISLQHNDSVDDLLKPQQKNF
jgi:WD40 repeat protein